MTFFSIEAQSWNMYNVFFYSTFLKISVVWLDGISRFTHLFCPLMGRDRDRAGLVIWHIVHFPSGLPHFWADGAVHQLYKNGRQLICSFSLLTLECPVKSLSVIGASPTFTVPSGNLQKKLTVDEVVKTWSLKVPLSLTSPPLVWDNGAQDWAVYEVIMSCGFVHAK